MKTLSQLKKDINVGVSILCTGIEGAQYMGTQEDDSSILLYSKELHAVTLNETMKKIRLVVSKNTTGIYLKSADDETTSRGSFCGYPKATDLEYIDNIFKITEKTAQGEIWQIRTYQLIK